MSPLPGFSAALTNTIMHGSVGYLVWTICYLAVLMGLSAYGVHRYFIIYLFLKNRKRAAVPVARFAQLPKVTVQLPIFNEIYVVERLLKSVSELDYPRELLQIQVLDDSTDNTREITTSCAEELRRRGFNVELIHRPDRVGFKAGALATGLRSHKIVCILDADFVAPPDLIRRTIDFSPTKGRNDSTRWGHLNRCYSPYTRAAMFLDGHLLLEQTARSRSGRFLISTARLGFGGSRVSKSRRVQHDTLTEDLDLSYRAQLRAEIHFSADVVTPAELPVV